MKNLEKILKALTNKRRLAILKYLKDNHKAPVGEIAGEINLSFKATSKHLTILSAVDIVEKNQVGIRAFYTLVADQKPATKYILSLL